MRSTCIFFMSIVLVSLMASACTSKPSDNSNSGSPESAKAQDQAQNAKGAASADSGSDRPGPASIKGGLTLPPGWPRDVPVMSDLTLQHAGTADNGLDIMLIGNVPMDKVEAFYSGLSGWNKGPGSTAGSPDSPGDGKTGARTFVMVKGGETLTVSLAAEESVTSVRLLYAKH